MNPQEQERADQFMALQRLLDQRMKKAAQENRARRVVVRR
jgi:hypothetical protein